MPSRRLLALLVLALAALLPASVGRAQLSVGQVKGLFIERFTRFIEWPTGVLPDDGPFEVCIQGTGETADALAQVVVTRKFKERVARVRRLSAGSSAVACHVLYLAPSESGRLPTVLASVADRPTLTVSDSPGFSERGVLINLYQEGRFLRFEINTAAVRKSQLVFSSQLLRLGRLVGPGAPP